jgi:hypothetical protein
MKPADLNIHPLCPKRLITALRRAKGDSGKGWNFSVLADQLDINKGIVYKLVVYGIEPAAQELRLKLFLSRHSRKRVGDCNHCGKRVEVMKVGKLESHVHPDGTYCPGSDSRDFLKPHKLPSPYRKPLPVHKKWWNKQTSEFKEKIIHQAWEQYASPEQTGVLVAKVIHRSSF